MKKQRWYAITHQLEGEEEEIVGYSHAMIFRFKEKAEEEFKRYTYSRRWELRNFNKKGRYMIRRIYV